MTEDDRNALIPRPHGAIAKAGLGPGRILSGMVADALDVVRSHDRALALARFRIGSHEFRDPDYRQIMVWAKALDLEPGVLVERLGINAVDKPTLVVEDGAIVSLGWDFDLLPILHFEWVDGLVIREIALFGAPAGGLSLALPLLDSLFCFQSGIADLDLSSAPKLSSLRCSYNQLTELDLSSVPALVKLDCTKNQITELNLSNVPKLSELSCSYNQLTELDLSSVPALVRLDCFNNQITELDIRRQEKLGYLKYDSSVKLKTLSAQNPE